MPRQLAKHNALTLRRLGLRSWSLFVWAGRLWTWELAEEGRPGLKLSIRADREGALARSRLRTKLANLQPRKGVRPGLTDLDKAGPMP